MSRGRRRTRDSGGALSSLQQADMDIYSSQQIPPEIAELDSRRKPARPVPIGDIYPDRSQPRRTVPTAVRQHWDGDPQNVHTLFEGWLYEIERAGNLDFDLRAYLDQAYLPDDVEGNEDDADYHRLPPYSALESTLLNLADLAISIQQHGLANPITVAKQGRVYQLETGERRWLAYHLLHIYFPDEEEWGRVPAYTVDSLSVWRQASENNARTDLNAIGRARQLAILLIDLLTEHGYEFYSFEEMIETDQSEREYYAQVADGNEYRIPRGTGERLLGAMGFKSPTQIRQYRRLLRLPDEIWQQADDENWTEARLRKIDDTVTTVTLSPSRRKGVDGNPFVESTNKKRRTKVWKYASQLDNLSAAEQEQALKDIEADERWLAELKTAIQRRRS